MHFHIPYQPDYFGQALSFGSNLYLHKEKPRFKLEPQTGLKLLFLNNFIG